MERKYIRDRKKRGFKTPIIRKTTTRGIKGALKCDCTCVSTDLPRNAILIRPHKKDQKISEAIYKMLNFNFQRGGTYQFAAGTCQLSIRAGDVVNMLGVTLPKAKNLLNLAKIQCMDNKDNTEPKIGDILLSRVGTSESIGKPFLITK